MEIGKKFLRVRVVAQGGHGFHLPEGTQSEGGQRQLLKLQQPHLGSGLFPDADNLWQEAGSLLPSSMVTAIKWKVCNESKHGNGVNFS